MIAADFNYVSTYLRDQAAIVLDPGKEYLVEARLQTLAQTEKLGSLEEFFLQLRADPNNGLHRKMIDAMTTNETLFFRDIHPFEALKTTILPELIARRGAERRLTFWCGAASTGQEPFSVLMLIAEHFPALLRWDISFVATDICRQALARAKAGRYSQLEVNRGLPASLLVKYFTRVGSEWEFSSELRRRVEFREMNLVREWPALGPMDLVFLRNVLIYFDNAAKQAILEKVRRLLRPDGLLLLGGAETTHNLDDRFERRPCEKSSFYRVRRA